MIVVTDLDQAPPPPAPVSEPPAAVPGIDHDAPPPELSPMDIAGEDSVFDSPVLSDPDFDPNGDTPLMMVEDGTVYLHNNGAWTAYQDTTTIGMHVPIQPVAMSGAGDRLPVASLSSIKPASGGASGDVAWLGGERGGVFPAA